MLQSATHHAIVIVDVESFGDPGRTNADQLAVREGLYEALSQAFARAGIAWGDCVSEDRGDGILVLVPATVPKSWLVTRLPAHLADLLGRHNAACPARVRIRLRLALHAGEVHQDAHGFTGNSLNQAFRLIESSASRIALRESSSVVALIVSDWFYDEVVRHHIAAQPGHFRKVHVAVKETEMTAWVRLLDARQEQPQGDSGTTALTLPARLDKSVSAYLSAGRYSSPPDGASTGQEEELASSTTEPRQESRLLRRVWGSVPARNPGFTGRDDLLAAVRKALLAGDRAVVQALHGMGGVGKTQLAAEYAHRFGDSYDLVWWIASEQAGLIGEQFAVLAEELGCAQPGATVDVTRRMVLAKLRERDRWLLVFDNAEEPEGIAGWLPGGKGHVLITSRARQWAEIAVPIEVDVLVRSESVTILRHRVPALSAADADSLADALGDLPLAVVQAAGYMADTGMAAAEYASLLATQATKILDQGRPASYPRSLAAVTQLAFDRLRDEDPAASELAALCSLLAPELIPPEWFTRAAEQLPAALAEKAANAVAWRQILAWLGRYALARIDQRGLQMHRLTQAILRGHLSCELIAVTRVYAEAILAANHPGDPEVPGTWPRWARLLPHLLALNPAATSNQDLRLLTLSGAVYLLRRGEFRVGHNLFRDLYQEWQDRLGPDGRHTLIAANGLAEALRDLGDPQTAKKLDEDTLARYRRILGDDNSWTLGSASNLALDLHQLGDLQAARELDEVTLANRRRVLGDDHPHTLISANNLAADLRELGDLRAARELDKDTLARRRRVLGDNHPRTLMSASNLAADLRGLGDLQAARELDKDTLARRRRVLGEDHPDTLASASNIAADLHALGET